MASKKVNILYKPFISALLASIITIKNFGFYVRIEKIFRSIERTSSESKYVLISYSYMLFATREIQPSIYFLSYKMRFSSIFRMLKSTENPIFLTERISDKYRRAPRAVKRKSSVCGAERKVSQQ